MPMTRSQMMRMATKQLHFDKERPSQLMAAEVQLERAGSVMKNYPTPHSGSHRGGGVSAPTT
eukprot:475354-Amphidinium_carterae.1